MWDSFSSLGNAWFHFLYLINYISGCLFIYSSFTRLAGHKLYSGPRLARFGPRHHLGKLWRASVIVRHPRPPPCRPLLRRAADVARELRRVRPRSAVPSIDRENPCVVESPCMVSSHSLLSFPVICTYIYIWYIFIIRKCVL